MKLRVWWMPQVPMSEVFRVEVENTVQADLLLNTLADYDQFQLDNQIKPDYANMGGLEMFEGGEWVDWHNEDGEDFDEYRERVFHGGEQLV